MLTAIRGVYENGQVILEEKPQTYKCMAVVVTFIEEIPIKIAQKRPFGTMKGTIRMSDDFNEPIDDYHNSPI